MNWDTFISDARAWTWPALTLFVCLGASLTIARRVLAFVARRTETKAVAALGGLMAALRRPVFLAMSILGIEAWLAFTDLTPETVEVARRITRVGMGLTVFLALDAFIQAWMRSRERDSQVLATSGHVLRIAARVVVSLVGGLMLLSNAGIDVTPILASLGVGSLAIGLALQRTLEDFFSGLLLAADQPVRVGDWIEFDGITGSVISIGWRSSRIQTLFNTYVIVPNSTLAQSKLINRSFPNENFQFQTEVGVGYESDLERVMEVLRDEVQRVHGSDARATEGFKVTPVCKGFGDSSVDFAVWCSASSWATHFGLKDSVLRAIRARFAAEKINIPFPIRTLDLPPATMEHLVAAGAPRP